MKAQTGKLHRRAYAAPLAAAVVAVAAVGSAWGQTQPAAPGAAAVVNGETITTTDVAKLLRQTPAGDGKNLPETQLRQMQYEALTVLIDDLLMQQFLRKYAPPADRGAVDKMFAQLQQGVKKQNQTMEQFYQETGQTEAEVRADIVKRLQRAAYVKQALTDAEARRYYDENRDFFDLVKVKASHILIRVPPGATESQKADMRARLLALREQIVTGKINFAEAAKKYSQCPTAPNGGDLGGYFPRKFAVQEPFAKAAFALKVGEVSDVVQTDYGMHLIKCVDRRQDGPPSDFEKIKDTVREFAAEEMMQNILLQMREKSQIQILLGNPAAAPAGTATAAGK